jgi:nucleotide-binding universal stress UspA family protein
MSNKMPVTRSLIVVDRVLSLLIFALGLIMAFLAITTSNITMGLASLIFLAIGFIKLRGFVPGFFRTMRIGSVERANTYKNILLPVSRPEAAESIIKMASDVMGPGGKLALINVIVLPPQLPTGAEVNKDNARALLKDATAFADRMGIDARAEIVTARSASDAILDHAREFRSDLIIMGSSQRTEQNGVKSEGKFETGNVADVILRMAREGNYSLIIIGATEHPRYYTALLGNIADDVVKGSTCDVLVVRTRL